MISVWAKDKAGQARNSKAVRVVVKSLNEIFPLIFVQFMEGPPESSYDFLTNKGM